MEWIETDLNALSGTAYVELLPGPYRGVFWNQGSLFFNEERFGHMEPLTQRHIPGYDHYAFTEADRVAWDAFLADLEELRQFLAAAPRPEELPGRVGFFFNDSERRFVSNLDENVGLLVAMLVELAAWLRQHLAQHEVISILGL